MELNSAGLKTLVIPVPCFIILSSKCIRSGSIGAIRFVCLWSWLAAAHCTQWWVFGENWPLHFGATPSEDVHSRNGGVVHKVVLEEHLLDVDHHLFPGQSRYSLGHRFVDSVRRIVLNAIRYGHYHVLKWVAKFWGKLKSFLLYWPAHDYLDGPHQLRAFGADQVEPDGVRCKRKNFTEF